MSSFVINKIEYVKAAGLMYGVEMNKSLPFRYFLDNVRENFTKCYVLNSMSVSEQYKEPYRKDYTPSYDDVFEEYVKKGRSIWSGESKEMTRDELKNALVKFFHSVLYQIENEKMNMWVSSFFWKCLERLTEKEVYGIEGWWGEVEI